MQVRARMQMRADTEDRGSVKSGEGLGLSSEQNRYRVVSAGPVGNWDGARTLTCSRRRVVMVSWLTCWELGIML